MTAVLRSTRQSARQEWHRGIVQLLQGAPSSCGSNQQLGGLWRSDGDDIAVASIIVPNTALSNRSLWSSPIDTRRACQSNVLCHSLQGVVKHSTTRAHSPHSPCTPSPAGTTPTTTASTNAVHVLSAHHHLTARHGMATSPSPTAVGTAGVNAAPSSSQAPSHLPASDINHDSLFRSKAQPLGVGPNPSVVLPRAPGLSGAALSLLGFYSKESEQIRAARALFKEVQARADDQAFLNGQ